MYQSFDILGKNSGDSATKYNNSKITNHNLNNKRILDIGCNAGYFLFRTNNEFKNIEGIGVDYDKHWIDTAIAIKKENFKDCNIQFHCMNIFEYNPNIFFDVVYCFSVFHYFVDRQKELIDKMYSMLSETGLFFLEVEVYPTDTNELVKKIRPADAGRGVSLDYPTDKKIREWTEGLFNIEEINKTYKQAGSLYDRFCYKLVKK